MVGVMSTRRLECRVCFLAILGSARYARTPNARIVKVKLFRCHYVGWGACLRFQEQFRLAQKSNSNLTTFL